MFLKRPLAGRSARIPLCQSSCRLDRAVPRFNLSRSTHAAFQHNLSLPSVERELVVQERRYPYWDHVVWCGALANFAYLPATARPITCTSAGLPMGIQIKGPYLEDRTPIHAALLMDDLFGGFVRPPQFEENKHGN